ncbi:MAG: proteasome subunit beta [archaeon]|nr:proteasome subunit beta [archaeon]
MDSVFGFVGDGYALIAADRGQARSIQVLKSDQDKSFALDHNKILVCSGDAGDRDQFCEYIQRNVHLERLRSSHPLSTHATAHRIRHELAHALRHGPYNVNLLLAGFDSSPVSASSAGGAASSDDQPAGSPSLWFIDYLASAQKLNFAVHGHAAYFVMSVLDKNYRQGLSLEEGLELVRLCINELSVRYLIKHRSFLVRVVDATGNTREIILE